MLTVVQKKGSRINAASAPPLVPRATGTDNGPANEFCNRCGKSVSFGSGKFINRVPDCNEIEARIECGFAFPLGDYVCSECDEESLDTYD